MLRALGMIVGGVSLVCILGAAANTRPVAPKTAKKSCDQRYRSAHVVKTVQPVAPEIAVTNGITGIVEVMVTVRASGAVVGAQAVSGPALLRQAAVDAALATTFVPEIRDCRPMPGAYSYFVDFSGS